jgi:streptomycin 6-kinase
VEETLAAIEEWRCGAPRLAGELASEWELTLGEPYVAGMSGYVVRAERADGTSAVLKLNWPHREAEQEAEALHRWRGDGSVLLLARDDARYAMLLERCEPGTFLCDAPASVDRLGVLIELLPRLWKDASGFRTLAEEVEHWALEGEVGELARELAATPGELVLVHQDLHGENVLAAQREPWLVIDPKPLAAEREFAVAPIVRSPELGHSKQETLDRLDRLCAELGLDRDRARGWTIVQTVAWAEGASHHTRTVEWLS